MGAHEVHIVGADPCLVHRQPERPLEAAPLGIGGRDVRAIARAGMAQEPPETLGPRLRVAPEQDERRRLAEEEPAAPAVEGAQLITREGAQGVEAAHHEATEGIVAAGDHRIGHPLAQEVGAEAERRGAGGAGRGDSEHGSPGAQPARQVVGGRVVEPAAEPLEPAIPAMRPLPLLHATQRGPDDDSHAGRIHGPGAQVRLGAELVGSGHQEAGGPAVRHAPPVPDTRERLDLAAALDAQIGHGETLDGRDAAGAGEERGPEGVHVLTDGRGDTGADDGDGLRPRHGTRSRCRRS